MTDERRHQGPNPFDGVARSFDEAFPDVAELEVAIEQYQYGTAGDRQGKGRQRFGKDRAGRFIRCDNPRCWQGGFDLQAMMRKMVANRTAEDEQSAICRGSERSPKGQKVYSGCGNYFTVRVRITYRIAGGR